METIQITRAYEDTEVPAPGVYAFDPAHSGVAFQVRHLMVSKVRGTFAPPAGTFTIAEDPSQSQVVVDINAASVSTGEETRDAHLRSADFLDVEHYPTIHFASTGVRHAKGNHWEVTGDLTVRDVTRPVTLNVEFEGGLRDPWDNVRVGFSATAEIDREAWGLNWNQVLETGGVLVGKTIKIEIAVEAVLS
jgi:polyisoprenoid-binding protein YceI